MYTRTKNGKIFFVQKVKISGKIKEIWAKTEEELHKKIAQTQTPCGFGLTLNDFSSYYISHINVRQSTAESYKYALQKLCDALGERVLIEITTIDIQTWISSIDVSAQTKRDYYAAIRTAFRRAVLWKLIPSSPCENIVIPRVSRSSGRALTLDELQSLFIRASPTLRVAIALATLVGMRISEVCGLRKDCIHDNIIEVKYQLKRKRIPDKNDIVLSVPNSGQPLVLTTPKTASSAASVVAPEIVFVYISELPDIDDIYGTGLLLLQRNSRPFEATTLRKRFKRLCNARFHDLRHTAATMLLEARIDPLIASRHMRHADVHITQSIYQHMNAKMQELPAIALNEIFSQSGGKLWGKTKNAGQVPELPKTRTAPDLTLWSGRRDSNSRPLVPETGHQSPQTRAATEFLLIGIQFFLITEAQKFIVDKLKKIFLGGRPPL